MVVFLFLNYSWITFAILTVHFPVIQKSLSIRQIQFEKRSFGKELTCFLEEGDLKLRKEATLNKKAFLFEKNKKNSIKKFRIFEQLSSL